MLAVLDIFVQDVQTLGWNFTLRPDSHEVNAVHDSRDEGGWHLASVPNLCHADGWVCSDKPATQGSTTHAGLHR